MLNCFFRCEVVLKPSFKTVTQNLIEDKTKLKKIQQEKSDKNQSVMSHHRKNERMKKYLHQVKYDAMLKKEAFRNLDFNLIDSRVIGRVFTRPQRIFQISYG